MNSKKPFDPSKPVQTRDGRPARIICTDLNGCSHKPIVALVKIAKDATQEFVFTYDKDGRAAPPGERGRDLVNIPEKVSRFFNVYETSPYRLHSGECFASIEGARIANQKNTSLGVLEVVTIDGTTVDAKFHRRSIG